MSWDFRGFHFINRGMSSDFLDFILPLFRNKVFWIPLYTFVISWIAFNFPLKKTLIILSCAFLSIFGSDTISSKLIKYEVKRLRPCQEVMLEPPAIARVSCGSGYSFTSSHAANHFCLAAFIIVVFGKYMRGWKHLWWLWAASISIAQVYVGVHYPLDILGGGVLGIVIGFSLGKLAKHLTEDSFSPA